MRFKSFSFFLVLLGACLLPSPSCAASGSWGGVGRGLTTLFSVLTIFSGQSLAGSTSFIRTEDRALQSRLRTLEPTSSGSGYVTLGESDSKLFCAEYLPNGTLYRSSMFEHSSSISVKSNAVDSGDYMWVAGDIGSGPTKKGYAAYMQGCQIINEFEFSVGDKNGFYDVVSYAAGTGLFVGWYESAGKSKVVLLRILSFGGIVWQVDLGFSGNVNGEIQVAVHGSNFYITGYASNDNTLPDHTFVAVVSDQGVLLASRGYTLNSGAPFYPLDTEITSDGHLLLTGTINPTHSTFRTFYAKIDPLRGQIYFFYEVADSVNHQGLSIISTQGGGAAIGGRYEADDNGTPTESPVIFEINADGTINSTYSFPIIVSPGYATAGINGLVQEADGSFTAVGWSSAFVPPSFFGCNAFIARVGGGLGSGCSTYIAVQIHNITDHIGGHTLNGIVGLISLTSKRFPHTGLDRRLPNVVDSCVLTADSIQSPSSMPSQSSFVAPTCGSAQGASPALSSLDLQ